MVKLFLVIGRLIIDRIVYVIIGIWMVVVVLVIFLLFIFYWDLKDYFCFFGDEEYEMMVYIDCLVVIFILVLFFLIVFFYF